MINLLQIQLRPGPGAELEPSLDRLDHESRPSDPDPSAAPKLGRAYAPADGSRGEHSSQDEIPGLKPHYITPLPPDEDPCDPPRRFPTEVLTGQLLLHSFHHLLHPLKALWRERIILFWPIWLVTTAVGTMAVAWAVPRGKRISQGEIEPPQVAYSRGDVLTVVLFILFLACYVAGILSVGSSYIL